MAKKVTKKVEEIKNVEKIDEIDNKAYALIDKFVSATAEAFEPYMSLLTEIGKKIERRMNRMEGKFDTASVKEAVDEIANVAIYSAKLLKQIPEEFWDNFARVFTKFIEENKADVEALLIAASDSSEAMRVIEGFTKMLDKE